MNLNIESIQQAAEASRNYRPLKLELASGTYTAGKLPGVQHDEGLKRFSGRLLALYDNYQNLELDDLVKALTEDIPGLAGFLLEHGCGLDQEQGLKLYLDERLLLCAAVITLTYIEPAGIRLFFDASAAVAQPASPEPPSTAQPVPNNGEKQ